MPVRLSDVLENTDPVKQEPRYIRLGDLESLGYIDDDETNRAFTENGYFKATPRQIRDWEAQGPIGFAEMARRVDKTEMMPFNPESAVKSISLLRAVNRLKADDYVTNPGQKSQDLNKVNLFLSNLEEQRIRNVTIGGRIAQGASALPSFMFEFLATGGAASIGKNIVKEGVEKIAKEGVKKGVLKATSKVAQTAAGAVTRTVAMPHRVAAGYAQRQVNASLEFTEEGAEILDQATEKPFTSLAKAYGDVVIENFSEATGPAISAGIQRVIPKRMAAALAKMWARLHPNESVTKLFTKAGYNGFLEELGEERIGDLLRAVTGVENFGVDDGNVFDRVVASIPDGEEMLVEAGVLAFPGAVRVGAAQTAEVIRRRRQESGQQIPDQGRDLTDQEADEIVTQEAEAVEEVEEPVGVEPAPPAEDVTDIEDIAKPEEVGEIEVFRGGKEIDFKKGKDKGISVSLDEGKAGQFAKFAKGEIQKFTISNNANILNFEDIPEDLSSIPAVDEQGIQKIVDYARANGFDAVDLTPLGEDEIRILNSDILISQPTEPAKTDGPIAQEIPDFGFRDFDTAIAKGFATEQDKEFTREVFRLTDMQQIVEKINSHPKVVEAEKKRNGQMDYWELGPNDPLPDNYQEYLNSKKLDQFETQEQPEAVFMIGLPAAQKSQFAGKMGLKETHVLIDPDQAKEFIEEFILDPGLAEFVHPESVYMSEDILYKRAIEQKLNILWPKLGKNPDSLLDKIKDLHDAGYKVTLIHNKLSVEESVKRSFKRFLEAKRYVPADYIIDKVGLKTNEVYDKVKGSVEKYIQNDVNVPFTQKPIELERGGPDAEVSEVGEGEGLRPGRVQRQDSRTGDQRGRQKVAEPGTAEAFEQKYANLTFQEKVAQAENIIRTTAEIDLRKQIGFRGMRKPPSGRIGEEIQDIPSFYFGKGKNLPTPDEMASQLGFESEDALIQEILEFERSRPQLETELQEAKLFLNEPVVERKRRTTRVKERIRTIQQGIREGKILARKEVKEAQTQIIDLLKGSDLEAKDREKFTRTIKNIQTARQLEVALPDIQSRIFGLQEKAEVRTLKGQIKKELKNVQPTKQAGKPVAKFTAETHEILDKLQTFSKMTRASALQQINDTLTALGDKLPDNQQILELRMLDLMAGLDDKNPAELRDLLDEIQTIKATGRAGKLLKDFARAERDAEMVSKSQETMQGRKPVDLDEQQQRESRVKQALKGFFIGQYGWADKLDLLSVDDFTSKANDSYLNRTLDVSEAIDKEKEGVRVNGQSFVDLAIDSYGFKGDRANQEKLVLERFREDQKLVDLGSFTNNRGKRINSWKLTKAQARKIWMELSDPSLRESLTGEEQLAEGLEVRGNAYSEEMIEALRTWLSPQDKAFAAAQMKFYRDYYESVNKVYVKRYGVNLPFNEFYSPIRREGYKTESGSEFLQDIGYRRSVASGSLKSRVGNLRPLALQSDIATLQKHILEMEHFKAWAETVKDLNTVFSNQDIRKLVRNKYSPSLMRSIDFHIQSFTQGGVEKAKAHDDLTDVLRVNFTQAALAIKPALTIKQMVSFVAFADNIPATEFMRGFMEFVGNPADIKRKTEILYSTEFMKQRSRDFTRDVKAAFASDEFNALSLKPSFKNMLMFTTRWGDQGAIVLGGWSVYSYNRRQGKTHEQALKAFVEASRSSQQSGDLDQLSDWQRGGPVQKLFTMFTSSQNQYFRKEMNALRNIAKGRITKKEFAKKFFIYHFLLPMFFQWVSDFGRWDKDEQLRAAIMGSVNGVFILKDILDSIVRQGIKAFKDESDIDTFFTQEIPAFTFGRGIEGAMRKLKDDDIELGDVLAALADLSEKTIAPLTGLPVKQIFNAADGLVDLGEGKVGSGSLKLMGFSPYIIDKKLGKKKKRKR